MPNPDEPFPRAIRQCGEALKVFPQVMGVRVERSHLHVNRQSERIFHNISRLSGRYINLVGPEEKLIKDLRGWSVCKVQPDFRLYGLRVTAGLHMQLDNQVRARRQCPGSILSWNI